MRDPSAIKTRFVRCSNCNTRKALRQKLCDYVRLPRCKSCGKVSWWADTYRQKRRESERKNMCYPGRGGCSMYPYPHRKGSGRCMERKLKQYKVRWEIEVDGSTPEEAAEHAVSMLMSSGTTATVFEVIDGKESHLIDMSQSFDKHNCPF